MKNFTTLALGTGEISRPDDARVIDGDPVFTTWAFNDAPVATGVWGATSGTHKVIRGEKTWEQFLILEGEIELTPEGGQPQRYGVGDVVDLPCGYHGVWRTLSPMRKFYVTTTVS